jgi:hypothetical protein
MKYVTVAVTVPVDDDTHPSEVQHKVSRVLGDAFQDRHVGTVLGTTEHATVAAFDQKFLVPNSCAPAWLDASAAGFRHKFIKEEYDELLEAYEAKHMPLYFDALLDLAWVTHGTATMMGLPWSMGWREVERANMAKERATGADDPRSKRKHPLDIVKPDGWKEPNHRLVLGFGDKFPTLNTAAAADLIVAQLAAGQKPSSRFHPAIASDVAAFAPVEEPRKAEA